MRLREGPILLVSFTNHPFRLKNGLNGMTFKDGSGKEYTGYGMYAALSFDEGKTWPVKKLLTDGKNVLWMEEHGPVSLKWIRRMPNHLVIWRQHSRPTGSSIC